MAAHSDFEKWVKRARKKSSDAQCIIAGFIEEEPVIVRVEFSGVDLFSYFVATGIGAYHADTILCWRKIHQLSNSLERVLYFLYEAKQFAQMCKDVGRQTLIEVVSLTH